jgi:hypothetical protein
MLIDFFTAFRSTSAGGIKIAYPIDWLAIYTV